MSTDVCLTPVTPDANTTAAPLTFGVASTAFSANSANAGGNNIIQPGDFTSNITLGNIQYGFAKPVTFTNISGDPLSVYAFVQYDPNSRVSPTNPLLMTIQAVPGGNITIPANGSITFTPSLGDFSQFLS